MTPWRIYITAETRDEAYIIATQVHGMGLPTITEDGAGYWAEEQE